jgi:hypothetical protein
VREGGVGGQGSGGGRRGFIWTLCLAFGCGRGLGGWWWVREMVKGSGGGREGGVRVGRAPGSRSSRRGAGRVVGDQNGPPARVRT